MSIEYLIVEKSFPHHAGRKGQRGGSLPRSADARLRANGGKEVKQLWALGGKDASTFSGGMMVTDGRTTEIFDQMVHVSVEDSGRKPLSKSMQISGKDAEALSRGKVSADDAQIEESEQPVGGAVDKIRDRIGGDRPRGKVDSDKLRKVLGEHRKNPKADMTVIEVGEDGRIWAAPAMQVKTGGVHKDSDQRVEIGMADQKPRKVREMTVRRDHLEKLLGAMPSGELQLGMFQTRDRKPNSGLYVETENRGKHYQGVVTSTTEEWDIRNRRADLWGRKLEVPPKE